jgi:Resolvase, N terminal domain
LERNAAFSGVQKCLGGASEGRRRAYRASCFTVNYYGPTLLETLRAGDPDALVVAKFDRLARSLVSFAYILKLSEAEGWTIICLDPQLDLRTAVGRAIARQLTSKRSPIRRQDSPAARAATISPLRVDRSCGFNLRIAFVAIPQG